MMTRMTNESKQKSDTNHMSQEVIEIFTFSMMQGRISVLSKSRPLFKPPLIKLQTYFDSKFPGNF